MLSLRRASPCTDSSRGFTHSRLRYFGSIAELARTVAHDRGASMGPLPFRFPAHWPTLRGRLSLIEIFDAMISIPSHRRHCFTLLASSWLLALPACDKSSDNTQDAPGIGENSESGGKNSNDKNSDSDGSKDPSESDTKKPTPDDIPDPNDPGNDPDANDTTHGVDCDDHKHKPCDAGSDDPLHAIGINCPGAKPQVEASFKGAKTARGVRSKLGNEGAFNPREGSQYLVLGTGKISKLDTPERSKGIDPVCSVDLGSQVDLPTLPAPMKTKGVGTKTCAEDPSLVGKGDCSNSIGPQWAAAAGPGAKQGAFDYSELRLKMKVPEWAKSLSFDFAFMTVEYPDFFQLAYNDFFVVWLESKKWTGNISFDKNGKPISLNAGFFDYKDSSRPVLKDPECLAGCDAKELHNSCLAEHASTKWLTTTVGVEPGEEIELIFAIVDLGDSSLDSFAFIDNFQWGCDEKSKPETDPPPI